MSGNSLTLGVVGSRRAPLYICNTVIPHAVRVAAVQGMSIVTGCAPGVDSATAAACRQAGIPCRQIFAKSKSTQHLHARTAQVIQASTQIIALPTSTSTTRSGTWLAVGLAIQAGKPVMVRNPGTNGLPSPKLWGNPIWYIRKWAGMLWWVPQIKQSNLFAG